MDNGGLRIYADTARQRIASRAWHSAQARRAAPVTLAKPKRSRRAGPEVPEGLVAGVIAILERGRPSRFAFESSVRHGLRVVWVLRGTSWRRADERAREVVALAFSRMAVARPSWEAGQRDACEPYYGGTFFCATCGGAIEETRRTRFCSRECYAAHQVRRNTAERGLRTWAERMAISEARKAENRKRQDVCDHCGGAFTRRHNAPEQRFCSDPCARAARRRPERPCKVCGTMFAPKHSYTETCSKVCALKGQRLRPKTCASCGEDFVPNHPSRKYCEKCRAAR